MIRVNPIRARLIGVLVAILIVIVGVFATYWLSGVRRQAIIRETKEAIRNSPQEVQEVIRDLMIEEALVADAKRIMKMKEDARKDAAKDAADTAKRLREQGLVGVVVEKAAAMAEQISLEDRNNQIKKEEAILTAKIEAENARRAARHQDKNPPQSKTFLGYTWQDMLAMMNK